MKIVYKALLQLQNSQHQTWEDTRTKCPTNPTEVDKDDCSRARMFRERGLNLSRGDVWNGSEVNCDIEDRPTEVN